MLRECYKQLRAHKLHTEEMDKPLAHHELLKFTQNEIDDCNSLMAVKEIEFVFKKRLQRKFRGPDGLQETSTTYLKRNYSTFIQFLPEN